VGGRTYERVAKAERPSVPPQVRSPSPSRHRDLSARLNELDGLEESREIVLRLRAESSADLAHNNLGDDGIVPVLENLAESTYRRRLAEQVIDDECGVKH
jgi:hypothetical protein